MKQIILKKALFFAFLLTFCACNSYYCRVLENKNPVNYCFNANVKQVKNAIKNGLGKYQIPELKLYFREDNRYDILNEPQNVNDAYLRTFLDYMKSRIYYKDGNALSYTADFYLHLDSISENKTIVTITTINPQIIIGVKPGIGDNWILGASNLKTVPPSTIEEYEILLIIGTQLGQKGMPPCNYLDESAAIIKYNW